MSEIALSIEEPPSLSLSMGERDGLDLEADGYVGTTYSPSVEVTDYPGGHRVAITSKRGSSFVTDEFDVPDGATGPQGVPCTHRWEGSVLFVTSASGTSSADLRGPQGTQGIQGEVGPVGPIGPIGPQGAQGETYQLTQADIEAIAALVTSEYIVAEGVSF